MAITPAKLENVVSFRCNERGSVVTLASSGVNMDSFLDPALLEVHLNHGDILPFTTAQIDTLRMRIDGRRGKNGDNGNGNGNGHE